MTKRILTFLIIGIATSLSAENLTFPEFSINVDTDWKHRVEEPAPVSDERGKLISNYRPDNEVGELKIQSYVVEP